MGERERERERMYIPNPIRAPTDRPTNRRDVAEVSKEAATYSFVYSLLSSSVSVSC